MTTGVVIVHGIGSQPQSETLRWFSEPLIEYLQAWHDSHPSTDGGAFHLDSAHLSYGEALEHDEPAHLELRLPAFHRWPAQTWLVAEAWWATRLDAPSLQQMFIWSYRHLGLAGIALIREAADRVLLLLARLLGKDKIGRRKVFYAEPGAGGALVELIGTALLLLAYLALFIPAVIALFVLHLLAFIPIQVWQRFVLIELIRPLIVDNLGDFKVYVDDEIQALHVRHKVEETVDWLVNEKKCDRICVIAHSQGTVVAFDALSGGHMRQLGNVKKFITAGAALNRAWLLAPKNRRLQAAFPPAIFWLDIWSFYDFVHGGKLRRPGNPVNPDSREVFNWMNVLTEHGAYWWNREQVASRIAQEIDNIGVVRRLALLVQRSRRALEAAPPARHDARRLAARRARGGRARDPVAPADARSDRSRDPPHARGGSGRGRAARGLPVTALDPGPHRDRHDRARLLRRVPRRRALPLRPVGRERRR